jgi:hypothetical protein
MVVALPSTHYISRRLMMAQLHLTDAKSWRLRLLRELCEGIKTIKFLASERRWEQAITVSKTNIWNLYNVFICIKIECSG